MAATFLTDLQARLGEASPPGPWMAITQERIDAFAAVTGDRQWIHVDPARCARESPFKAPVAHGFLVLSLIPEMMAAAAPWAAFSTGLNYGCDKVRFPAPVRAGCRIRLQQTLKDVQPYKGGGVKAVIAATVEVEGETQPACYAELVTLLFP